MQNGVCKCLFEIRLMEFDHAYSFLCFLFTNIHANGSLFLCMYLHMDICAQLRISCLCVNCSPPVHKKYRLRYSTHFKLHADQMRNAISGRSFSP